MTPKIGQREETNSPTNMIHYLAAETMNLNASLQSNVNIDGLKKDFGTTLNVVDPTDQQSDRQNSNRGKSDMQVLQSNIG